MKAWLHAIRSQLVFDRNLAAEMAENKAHEVCARANRNHPEYVWEIVKVPGRNLYVVEGTNEGIVKLEPNLGPG